MSEINALKVVLPMAITPAMMIDTNVLQDDYPEWVSTATYAKAQRTMIADIHKVYESVADGNTGNNPTATVAEPKWLLVGDTNRWRAFDKSISSQTANPYTITYQIRPGRAVTYIAALNLTGATSMRIRMVDPAYGEVYNKVIALASIPVSVGWWEWFFGERVVPSESLFAGLPTFPFADIFIEIAGTVALAVGTIILGQMRTFTLGVKTGARVGIQDYSRKDRTEFGDTIVDQRGYAKRASFSLPIENSQVDSFNKFMASVRATACLWIGSDKYEATTVYGFYKTYEIILDNGCTSEAEIDLEGLT